MRQTMAAAFGFTMALALELSAVAYRADNPIGDIEDSGGAGVSWPLTAEDYLDMNGNEIRTDGQLTFTDAGATQGFTLQIGADVMELLDQAGTGAADLALQTGGQLHLEGASGNTYLQRIGSQLYFFIDDSNPIVIAGGVNQNLLVGQNWAFQSSTAAAQSFAHRRPDATPSDDDEIVVVLYQSYDDTPTANQTVAKLVAVAEDVSAGSMDGSLYWSLTDGGVETQYFGLDATDGSEGVYAAKKLYANGGMVNNVGTTLPATCSQGEQFHDTDSDDCADTGGGDGAVCICKTTNTWALVADI